MIGAGPEEGGGRALIGLSVTFYYLGWSIGLSLPSVFFPSSVFSECVLSMRSMRDRSVVANRPAQEDRKAHGTAPQASTSDVHPAVSPIYVSCSRRWQCSLGLWRTCGLDL